MKKASSLHPSPKTSELCSVLSQYLIILGVALHMIIYLPSPSRGKWRDNISTDEVAETNCIFTFIPTIAFTLSRQFAIYVYFSVGGVAQVMFCGEDLFEKSVLTAPLSKNFGVV